MRDEYSKFPRGSEWRKWDLHVHSPASFNWGDGKQLREMSPDERHEAMQRMHDAIVSTEPVAFAVVDYWTFDGYLEFRRFLSDRDLELEKAVFPGMELRILAPTNYRLNLQVVLSDALSDQQLADFRSQLHIPALNRKLSDEALMRFAAMLGADKANLHGFACPDKLSEGELWRLGSMTAEISPESLQDALSAVPEGTALVVMPYETSDGLKDLNWKKHPHADVYYMQLPDIFEARDPDAIDLFIGRETDANRHFLTNFQKALGDSPKPVVCGSDAHRFSDYGVFPGRRATWIKANPSFEGLKQIVFEPAERVRIQEESPSKKLPYLVIDKVSFRDETEAPRFDGTPIHFNPDLNVIIGGKSSGKSLLLYHVAKTVDPEQVAEKWSTLGEKGYDCELDEGFDFEVVWGDDVRMCLKEDREDTRRITYIPQMYINHLAEERGEQHLKELIESVLDQNDEYRAFREETQAYISKTNSRIPVHIDELFRLREEHAQLRKEIRDIGETGAIEKQIQTINRDIEQLRKSSGFTKEESEAYELLARRQSFHVRQVTRFRDLLQALSAFSSVATQGFVETGRRLLQQAGDDAARLIGSDKLGRRLVEGAAEKKQELIQEFAEAYAVPDERLRDSIQKKIEKHRAAESVVKQLLLPYLAKVKNQKFLRELQDQLAKEREKLKKIAAKEKRLAEVVEKGKEAKRLLLERYADLHRAYMSISAKLANPPFDRIGDELHLEAAVDFDSGRFAERFLSMFDRRSNFRALFGECFENNEFVYVPGHHDRSIETIFETISRGAQTNVRLRAGDHTPRDATFKLFDDYFSLTYTLTQRGDSILKMSPGKRGLVLLELILHLSNSEDPILIDQPEDNLDNRTIYNELNEFVKSKKTQRQIIFVTHNANLVVATDAENVIVANQSGQDQGKDNREFAFEYVSGGLELTFRDPAASGVLFQMGTREHACDILEGGQEAFLKRERKYGFRR